MSSDWRSTTLGEICSAQGGAIQTGPFGSQLHTSDYKEVGVPVVMPTNIGDGGIVEDGIARIDQSDVDRLTQHKLQLGDIVFSRRGDVTKNALIRQREAGWFCGTGCLKVRLGKEKRAAAKFISHCLRSPEIKDWLVRHAVGATMPNLNTGILSAVPIILPPLKTQQDIAEMLDALDDRITLLRETNATLEAIAQAIFKSWFVDFDPVRTKQEGRAPEGMDEATAALFPYSFEESALGLVPRGWRVATIGDVASQIFSGGTPDTRKPEYWSGDVPWFSSGETRSRVIISTEKTINQLAVENSSTKLALSGDVLIASAGQGHTRGQTSYCAITTYINQSVVALRANPKVCEPLWLYYNLSRRYAEMRDLSDSHSSRGSLTTKLLGGMRVIVPDREVCRAFANVADKLMESQVMNKQRVQTLSILRDTLLPRLISGQLRVPDAEDAIAESIA